MKNKLILWGWSVLTWFAVPRRIVGEIAAENRAVLQKEELWPQGGYIEQQAELEALRFGKSYTMAYGGCGLIALYNALVALGAQPSTEVFLELAADLQREGVAWGGKYGIHPKAIAGWLKKHDYTVKYLGISDEELVENEKKYHVFIVTVLNGAKLRYGMHTVCITRSEAGFEVHNGPAKGSFNTLLEAVRRSSRQGARAIYAMGVRKCVAFFESGAYTPDL